MFGVIFDMKNQNSLISLAYIKVSENPLRVFCNYILYSLIKEPGKETKIFEGRVNGNITPHRRGESGFGFDPVFIPNGFDRTFAEMTSDEKASISHRGQALKLFLQREFNV